MRIEQIEVRNYRAFRDVRLAKLSPMTVVVGANGSGKSTLLDVFSFLKEALDDNVASATARRGEFRELVSRGEQGPVRITVKFRESGGRRATYILDVGSEQGGAVVEREVLRYRRGRGAGRDRHLLDFSRGSGRAIANESVCGEEQEAVEERDYELDDPSVLAIKGLGQFREFRVASEFRGLIENWNISDFKAADSRPSTEAGYSEHQSARGEYIAQVGHYLYENHPGLFNRVLEVMARRVPGLSGVEVLPTEDGRLVLRFQDGSFKDPFTARHVSDGTIKMFGYLVLLYDPKPHPLLAVEEPEKQLYPPLLGELIEEFRDYARRGGQVFVSTHSPDFLSGAELEEIYWLEKNDGFVKVCRVGDSQLLRDLVEEGDRPGALLKQNLIGRIRERCSQETGRRKVFNDSR